MATTKAQELQALSKIRKILSELDSDKWINNAFLGICDIAESNIRNDEDTSPVNLIDGLQEEILNLMMKLEKAEKDRDSAVGKLNSIKKNNLNVTDQIIRYREFFAEVSDYFESKLIEANETILEHCEKPNRKPFKKAVADRQEAIRWIRHTINFMKGERE